MLTKISHKLFSINIGIILALTLVFVFLSYRSSSSMFSNALNGIDRQVMKDLSVKLSEHYRTHGSWEPYIDNRSLWDKTVNEAFFTTFFQLMEKVKGRLSQSELEAATPPSSAPPVGGNAWDFPFGTFLQRLSLLDSGKNPLIRAEIHRDKTNSHPIKLDGKLIGWLNVGTINVDALPLAHYFFQQQVTISYWTAIVGGFVAAVLSFLLSRHITAPIKKLTFGARQIAKRNYLSPLSIHTRDELQDLAESLNAISHELSQFEKRQKQWLMDISHELRTPVAVLISEISAICDNLTRCDVEAVSSLQQEVMQIKRLVDDLHDLFKIEEMGFQFVKEELDLHELIRHLIKHYGHRFEQKGIALHERLTSETISIVGDHDRLSQVVRNLLENCLQYTESPGEVWLSCALQGDRVILIVEDSGPGIPEGELDKIFDRLYRADTSRSRVGGGAGLGLSICKEIVVAHSGVINASHSDKGGLKIQVALPISGD